MANKQNPPPQIVPDEISGRSRLFMKDVLRSIYQLFYTTGGQDGAFRIPSMTETQRDALKASNGMIIYNETANAFNFYENGSWVTK